MKPYPGKKLSAEQANFNKRLSRARAAVECAFGRVCQKWRIFYGKIEQVPETAELIVKAACILYNAILDKETESVTVSQYDPKETAKAFQPLQRAAECADLTRR